MIYPNPKTCTLPHAPRLFSCDPAQVSFYDWGANDRGIISTLATLGKVIVAADVVLAAIVMVNWSEVSRAVKDKQA